MADTKLRNLTATTTPATTDLLYLAATDPATNINSRKVAVGDLLALAPGGLALLESHVASASAAVQFTTRNATGRSGATFQSDYDEYYFEFQNIQPATTNVLPYLQFSTDGGSSWLNSGYRWSNLYNGDDGGDGVHTQSTGGTVGTIGIEFNSNLKDTAGEGLCGYLTIYNPLSTTQTRSVSGQIGYLHNSGPRYTFMIMGAYTTTGTAINAIQFLMSSGNVASGTIRCYGISNV